MDQGKHVKRAVDLLGGPVAAAAVIGVSRQALAQWIHEDRPVPIERSVVIERATDGQVTRRQLRPDDWWAIWPELVDAGHPAGEPAL